jgi:molybdopterin converting factor small subunit
MHIQIKYLVTLRRRTGKRQERVNFPQESTLYDVAAWLNKHYAISLPTPHVVAMLNGKVWDLYPQKWSTEIQEGDEICFFPPVSGG